MLLRSDALMINPMALRNCKHNNKKIYAEKHFYQRKQPDSLPRIDFQMQGDAR
jgi:hypothetical protein